MGALSLRAPLRRGLLALIVLMLLSPVVAASGQAGGTGTSGEAGALTVTGARTAEELSACLQQRPNLAVALLIDETGSLARTDKDDERAPVLAGFLSRLEDIDGAAFGDGSRQVFVSIAYFGTGVSERLPWSPIDSRLPDPSAGAGATRSIARMVLEETPGRNRAPTTEFNDALVWATARHREVPGLVDPASVCTMTLWFSDGELDPDNARRGTPYERPAVIAATETLCEPGGVLDGHRRVGAALVGILLIEELTESSAVTALPRMHAMVEGLDPEQRPCGSEPSRGLFLEGDLDLLSLQFERAVAPGQGGVLQGTYRGDPVDFVVDPGVSRVRIVMSARDGFALRTASGATIEVPQPSSPPRTSGLPRGVQPDIRWASGAVSIDLEVAGAFGTWQVVRSGRSGPVDVYYFTDLRFLVDRDDVRLTSGEPGALSGRLVDAAGEHVDLSVYDARVLSGSVDGQPLTSALISDDGTFRVEFPVDTDEARIPARLRLDLTTRGGTQLQPITVDVSLPVALPGWFPEVVIARGFDRTLVPGSDEAGLAITAIGSDLGPTRVCVRPGAPGDGSEQLAQLVRLQWDGTDLSRCVDLATGERRDALLVAELLATEVRERTVGFSLVVELQSAAVDGRPSVTVDYEERRSVVVEPAPPNPWIVFVLLALGLLIPLLILHLLNHRAARFRTRNLKYAYVPVLLDRSAGTWQVTRESGRALLEPDDLEYLPNDALDGQRGWTAVSPKGDTTGESWSTVVPRWPLGTVRAVVESPSEGRVISNESPTTTSDGRTAGIGLNPQRSAYLIVPDAELRSAADPGTLRIGATLVTVLGHEGPEMPTVVRDHAHDLQTGLTGGDQVDRLIAAVAVEDLKAADSGTATEAAAPAASGDWGAWAPDSGGGGDVWPPSSPSGPSTPPSGPSTPPAAPPAGPPPDTKRDGGHVPGWD